MLCRLAISRANGIDTVFRIRHGRSWREAKAGPLRHSTSLAAVDSSATTGHRDLFSYQAWAPGCSIAHSITPADRMFILEFC